VHERFRTQPIQISAEYLVAEGHDIAVVAATHQKGPKPNACLRSLIRLVQ
jgi:hypothetical protein